MKWLSPILAASFLLACGDEEIGPIGEHRNEDFAPESVYIPPVSVIPNDTMVQPYPVDRPRLVDPRPVSTELYINWRTPYLPSTAARMLNEDPAWQNPLVTIIAASTFDIDIPSLELIREAPVETRQPNLPLSVDELTQGPTWWNAPPATVLELEETSDDKRCWERMYTHSNGFMACRVCCSKTLCSSVCTDFSDDMNQAEASWENTSLVPFSPDDASRGP